MEWGWDLTTKKGENGIERQAVKFGRKGQVLVVAFYELIWLFSFQDAWK